MGAKFKHSIFKNQTLEVDEIKLLKKKKNHFVSGLLVWGDRFLPGFFKKKKKGAFFQKKRISKNKKAVNFQKKKIIWIIFKGAKTKGPI